MKLTVVIVNYNVKYYLEQCLCSLYRAIGTIPTEVIVVDNASTDGSETYIPARYPSLTYIYNKENVGFSRANNQAIRQAQGEYVLLLNPDTVLAEDTLKKALEFMDAHPKAGATGVKMITGDGGFLPESKRGYPTLAATFGKLTGLGKLFPHSSLNGYYCETLDMDAIHSIEVLAGAFMLMRRSALEKSGLLDETFFMYGEDIDLSCRIVEAGYQNYYLPYPILHYKGESTSKYSYRHVRVFCKAMDIFFCKHSKRYSRIGYFLVRIGIYMQMYLRMGMLFVHHLFSRSQKPQVSPRFLVLGGEDTIRSLQILFKRYGLEEQHHYVIANNLTTLEGHGSIATGHNFTHVVYDTQAFSFSTIIDLLFRHQNKGVNLGLYNPESRVLVTPEKCYF